MKNILYCLILFSLFVLPACDKEDSLVAEGAVDVNIPQAGDNPVDQRIYEYYTKYGSSFLYEFDREIYDWNLVRSQIDDDSLTHVQNPLELEPKLDFLEEIWLSAYPEDFLTEKLPYRILLLDSIADFQGTSWDGTAIYEYLNVRSGLNFLAISHMGDSFAQVDSLEMKKDLHSNFIKYLVVKELFDIPASFYEVSGLELYRKVLGNPDYEGNGFFHPGGMYNYSYPTQSEDVADYVGFIATTPEAEVMNVIGTYPKMVQKYEILKAYFDSLGFNFNN